MNLLIIGIVIFSIILGPIRIIQKYNKLTYTENTFSFLTLFVIGICSLLFIAEPNIYPYLHTDYISIAFLTGFLYLTFSYFWSSKFVLEKHYKYETVPEVHHEMLSSGPRYTSVKFLEVLFQDVVALVMVLGLYEMQFSIISISILFSTLVFILHIGTPFIFGKYYGNYFLFSGTMIAFAIPWLLLNATAGLYVLISVHLMVYVLMLLGSRTLHK
ncbi:hypothetical protein H6785_04120 [Candidatus Nomurabacteria bacterium]|nr:hypothetical protein [Candidatus Nomurabacteria bacterium]